MNNSKLTEIYMDYAASTPMRKEVVEAMQPFFTQQFANPHSVHAAGLHTKDSVDKARTQIAKILNCKESEIIFTASGSESINLAIQGVAKANGKGHIITSAAEHSATIKTCEFLEAQGFQVTYLLPDKTGRILAKQVESAIQENTILITLLYVNNEVGTINPIAEIAKIATRYQIPFHLDACQATNYLNINTKELGINLMTINSSKIYGPKGIALLFIKENTNIKPLIYGGSQENNLRAGTLNSPCIIGFAKALDLVEQEKTKESKRLMVLMDSFYASITTGLKDVFLNSNQENRSPNILNLSFLGIDAATLVQTLSSQNLFVSSGSACTAGIVKSSHVLEAMGLNEFRTSSSIRFSLGIQTTQKEVDAAAQIVIRSVTALRKVSKNYTQNFAQNY